MSYYCWSWRSLHRRTNAGIVWVSAPGDYATFNSNHTPDGTAGIQRKLQCGEAVERRKLVIGENQVNSTVFKSGLELGAGLDAVHFTDEMFRFKEVLNERRVRG